MDAFICSPHTNQWSLWCKQPWVCFRPHLNTFAYGHSAKGRCGLDSITNLKISAVGRAMPTGMEIAVQFHIIYTVGYMKVHKRNIWLFMNPWYLSVYLNLSHGRSSHMYAQDGSFLHSRHHVGQLFNGLANFWRKKSRSFLAWAHMMSLCFTQKTWEVHANLKRLKSEICEPSTPGTLDQIHPPTLIFPPQVTIRSTTTHRCLGPLIRLCAPWSWSELPAPQPNASAMWVETNRKWILQNKKNNTQQIIIKKQFLNHAVYCMLWLCHDNINVYT